ncbi:MAG: DNA helicase RecQ [Gammaproteobacteria bacterium]|nr:MAG: DNA helicase RecQ [Gammaproteobacteria bacterium]
MQQAQDILHSTFGYSEFRHHQEDIIHTVVEGGDVLALMPTGGGKSLCYQIPSILRPGVGVIVSPLIALMQDQVDALRQLGIKAAFLNSTQGQQTQLETENAMRTGDLDLLYVAPERLLTRKMLDFLQAIELALFAIDEAHCVSQWGHDFRKEYQRLSLLHEHFPDVPRIAMTATADERTREEIIQQLDLHQATVYINSFDRPNIRYTIAEGNNSRDQLLRFLQREHQGDSGIVYCLSRRKVEDIADWLCVKGYKALPYHAGLSDEIRQQNQQRFLREDNIIIVATIAFGMGIDKPDVRFVAHLNLPKSIESYYQETGRAGRDGKPANAWMTYGLQDVIKLRQMTQESDANEQYKRVSHHKLEAMLGLCELISCRRQVVLDYFGEFLDQPCGNCDNCLDPPQTWDGTEAAQKALSAVYRTGQLFGVNYVVDVLTGKDDDRIRQNRHDQLAVYGIGTELNAVEWRGLYRQLISLGYLSVDAAGHGSLKLSEKCRPLLRSELKLDLRKPYKPEKTAQVKSSGRRSELRPCDKPLFEALRKLRLELAEEQDVPPYVIFHDTALIEMARKRPDNADTMRYISGVGEQKLRRYGKAFLQVIEQFPLPDLLDNRLSDTINETLYHYTQGKDVQQIADERQLKASSIYSHLADAIEVGLLQARQVLTLEDIEYTEIVKTIDQLDVLESGKLKPVYEELDGEYDYGVLKCVLAEIMNV